MIVHLQSTVQAILGIVDENGDVKATPYTIRIDKLDKATWDAAFEQLQKIKEDLKAKASNPV